MGIQMFVLLLAGLAIFLLGLGILADSLKRVAGDRVRKVLQKYSSSVFTATVAGTAVTSVIQSSSATTVMVVALVNAGIMNMKQAAGVILGANIGTTITSQIIAFDISYIAPVAIFIGLGMIMLLRSGLREAGIITTGFGVVFAGMDIMAYSMEPLQNWPMLVNLLIRFENPLWGVTAGSVMTAVIQSSSASVAILQSLAISGVVELKNCIYLLYGYNIGTCVTAFIACVGLSRAAKQAAFLHLLFNVLGVCAFILIESVGISYVSFIASLTPDDPVRQIANAHTGFNIISAVIIYPFINGLIKLVSRLIPEYSWENRKNLSTKKYAKAL